MGREEMREGVRDDGEKLKPNKAISEQRHLSE